MQAFGCTLVCTGAWIHLPPCPGTATDPRSQHSPACLSPPSSGSTLSRSAKTTARSGRPSVQRLACSCKIRCAGRCLAAGGVRSHVDTALLLRLLERHLCRSSPRGSGLLRFYHQCHSRHAVRDAHRSRSRQAAQRQLHYRASYASWCLAQALNSQAQVYGFTTIPALLFLTTCALVINRRELERFRSIEEKRSFFE